MIHYSEDEYRCRFKCKRKRYPDCDCTQPCWIEPRLTTGLPLWSWVCNPWASIFLLLGLVALLRAI